MLCYVCTIHLFNTFMFTFFFLFSICIKKCIFYYKIIKLKNNIFINILLYIEYHKANLLYYYINNLYLFKIFYNVNNLIETS